MMKKSFRFRMSRVISSFQWQWQWQWQSCRSKDPTTLPLNPVPSSSTFIHRRRHNIHEDGIQARTVRTKRAIINLPKFSTAKSLPAPHQPDHPSSLKGNLSTAAFSTRCGIRDRHAIPEEGSCPGTFQWQQEDKWHVLMAPKVYNHRRKIYTSSATAGSSDADDDVVLTAPHPVKPPAVSELGKKKKKRKAKNKKRTTRPRVSTSSADSCGYFSSRTTEEQFREFPEGTKTLVTTPEFISSGNYHESKRTKLKKSKKKVSKQRRSSSFEMMCPESPARLSVFQRFIPCKVEGKVRESLAVVKTSEDPYEDFRRSMMEMILEKNMFEDKDLEQLLQCFLSLNSGQHHGVIIQAFSEIWNALFGNGSKR